MSQQFYVLSRNCLFALFVFLLTMIPCLAQSTGASISGIVRDSSEASIPDASVNLINSQTGTQVHSKTNGSGSFFLTNVLPGPYTLQIERDGFETVQLSGILLNVGDARTLTINMHVGSTNQTVDVTGNDQLINTSNAEISQVITHDSITELPLNGRDPSSLAFLTTGVTNVLNAPGQLGPGGTALPTETNASAGGGRQGSTYYLLDGAPNMDTYMPLAAPFPNADATQEFRIISNNFDARYGYAPDAVVSIQTRSGTNEFHGGAFEFLRNSALNAANYFSHQVDTLRRNQFGGYLGGPIVKDKLFFFANYQGTRSSTAATANVAYTPTQAMLHGDFSAVPIALKGGFQTINGKPNQINPGNFSSAAVAIATTAVPLGQNPATGQINYVAPAAHSQWDEGTARIDYSINPNHNVFLRSFTQNYLVVPASVNGNLMAVVPGQPGKYYNNAFGHSWVISPSAINDVTAFWTQLSVSSASQPKDINGNAICLSRYVNVNDPPGQCYLEGLSISNGFSSGYNEPQAEIRTTWGMSDNFTKTFGNHTLTFGGNFYHQFAEENTLYPALPIISFGNQYTGFGLSDFLLGEVTSYEQGGGETIALKGWQFGLFAQDQFRVRPDLTLTVGLRWDPNTPPGSIGGRGSVFRPGAQSQRFPNAPAGMIFPGDPGVSDALMPTTWNYFQPRIGVSWQPHSLPGTAVRAGFGMFTGPLAYSTYNHTVDIAPFSPTFTLNSNPSSGYNIPFANPWQGFAASGGTSPFPPFASVNYTPPANSTFQTPVSIGAVFAENYHASMTESWNVSVDQQFGRDFALHLSYVGSESYHLGTILDENPGIYANGGNRTTYPNFSQILEETSLGTSPYNSLQVRVEKKMSHGIQVTSNFTWSKVLDLSSSGNLANQGGIPNPFDIGFNRGISNLNVPIVSVTQFIYTSPALAGRNLLERNILGSWELSSIYTIHSGSPFGISGGQNSSNNSGSLQREDRADVVPGVPAMVHQGSRANWLVHYVNAGSFRPNAPGTFGDSGRNIFTTPRIDTADVMIGKNWSVDERFRMQFRWEMFNAFNHTSWGGPNTDPTSSNFGAITGIGSVAPRVMQAGLKVTF
jgi:hypothetical protein